MATNDYFEDSISRNCDSVGARLRILLISLQETRSGDAGESAACGAAAVGIASRRRARSANHQAEEQAKQQAAAANQAMEEQIVNFKKAFSVCLESKEYMVKY